ncbi:uncharacterized protein RCC_07935 [Ramularia collo-cygni]|uniref:Uncharacterized protein n=1 Tax=Ramularia collo-cygni TaxID=112498 RepID=A0A2D3V5U0_9PEZI|nr:uncharacterized protein RCC_07935 [Ramularia collo-cygni]CZT22065.1 uncharacterized protein RCC_07935 [Ramularia collo-cygni]
MPKFNHIKRRKEYEAFARMDDGTPPRTPQPLPKRNRTGPRATSTDIYSIIAARRAAGRPTPEIPGLAEMGRDPSSEVKPRKKIRFEGLDQLSSDDDRPSGTESQFIDPDSSVVNPSSEFSQATSTPWYDDSIEEDMLDLGDESEITLPASDEPELARLRSPKLMVHG